MARYSTVREDHIEYAFWLSFDKGGNIRLTRNEPHTSRSERAVSMLAKLPKSLFTQPILKATLEVDNIDAPSTLEFDVDVATAALKQALGVDIDLVVSGGAND